MNKSNCVLHQTKQKEYNMYLNVFFYDIWSIPLTGYTLKTNKYHINKTEQLLLFSQWRCGLEMNVCFMYRSKRQKPVYSDSSLDKLWWRCSARLTNRKPGNKLWQLGPVQEICIFLRGHVSFYIYFFIINIEYFRCLLSLWNESKSN